MPMSPIEVSTGIVLPLWAPPRGYGRGNRHHAHFYEKTYLNGSDESRAVRFSRLQFVDRKWHEEYHDSFKGTRLPPDSEVAFRAVILNAAKYIPRFAVDMTHGCPDIIELSKKQKKTLRHPKVFSIERSVEHREKIGNFLMNYSIDQELEQDKQYEVEEFVSLIQDRKKNWRKQERTEQLGMELTNTAIELAVSPIEENYRIARQEKFFAIDAPRTAFRALKNYVRGHEQDYFQELGQRLATNIGAV